MRARGALVAGAGWSGTDLPAPAGQPASGGADWPTLDTVPLDPATLARLFPGRWKPQRELPAGLEHLVAAFARALAAARWWAPGRTEPLDAALALGTDSHPYLAADGFARELRRRGPAGASPSAFLFSLPSSAAGVLGILFGARGYQATLVEGGLSGAAAMAHVLDLLQTGKIDRAAVGAFSVARAEPAGAASDLELAVALCLEAPEAARAAAPKGRLCRLEDCCILNSLESVPQALRVVPAGLSLRHRHLAAFGLLAAAVVALEGPPGRHEVVVGEREPSGAAVARFSVGLAG